MGGYYYTTEQGDMWDFIAWKVYKNEKMIETLMKAEENRKLLDIYIFSAGTKVWCPQVKEQGNTEAVAPWRDNE